MRFDLPESIEAMRVGRKTQTRRRSAYWLKKTPGSTITIVHRGKQIGRATVKRVWPARILFADVQAEGYPSWQHFWQAWLSMYPDAEDSDVVTVISFEDIRWRNG